MMDNELQYIEFPDMKDLIYYNTGIIIYLANEFLRFLLVILLISYYFISL